MNGPAPQSLRALLFVPASEERKLAKMPEIDADGIIVDLEDAVPQLRKAEARLLAAHWLPQAAPNAWMIVRVNSEPDALALDLEAVVGDGLGAVMLPKLESEGMLHDLDRRLTALERQRSLEPGGIAILGLIETAQGVVASEVIARSAPDRLLTFCVGSADLAADLRLPHGAGTEELVYARSRVVLAARAAGLVSPLDGPYPSIQDLNGLRADSQRSRALGFQGRLVLHPRHVGPVWESYSGISIDGLDFAKRVVAAFTEQLNLGVGVIRVDDMVIDEPVYQRYAALLRDSESAMLSHEMQSGGGSNL